MSIPNTISGNRTVVIGRYSLNEFKGGEDSKQSTKTGHRFCFLVINRWQELLSASHVFI